MKSGFDMKWNEAKAYVLKEYGVQFDGEPEDDPCFYCPHCNEPIYSEDFPYLHIDFKGIPLCPICEEPYN